MVNLIQLTLKESRNSFRLSLEKHKIVGFTEIHIHLLVTEIHASFPVLFNTVLSPRFSTLSFPTLSNTVLSPRFLKFGSFDALFILLVGPDRGRHE